MCTDCKRELHGTIYCEACLAREMRAPVPGVPVGPGGVGPQGGPIPGLALGLGFIPGVGAIYNGQYAKGLVHVVIVGLIISVLANDAARGFEPLVGLMLAAFFFYMAFEAHHTARRRQQGLVVDEFSSLFPSRGGNRFPIAPILLIVLGVIFLLNNLDYFQIERFIRFWPALLIVLGVYMLYLRMAGSSSEAGSPQDRGPR
jgi:hypothetical protein